MNQDKWTTGIAKDASLTPLVVISFFVVVILDQLSKYLVVRYCMHLPKTIVQGFFYLTYTPNTGGIFGIGAGNNAFFVMLSIAIIFLTIFFYKKVFVNAFCAGGLILGGAAGNLIDRLRLKYVIDFLDISFWPVFNISDIAITLGIILFLLQVLKAHYSESKGIKSPFIPL